MQFESQNNFSIYSALFPFILETKIAYSNFHINFEYSKGFKFIRIFQSIFENLLLSFKI